jgi:hypothetical protein
LKGKETMMNLPIASNAPTSRGATRGRGLAAAVLLLVLTVAAAVTVAVLLMSDGGSTAAATSVEGAAPFEEVSVYLVATEADADRLVKLGLGRVGENLFVSGAGTEVLIEGIREANAIRVTTGLQEIRIVDLRD